MCTIGMTLQVRARPLITIAVATFLLAFLHEGDAAAQDECIDYSDVLHVITTASGPGECLDLCVEGDVAYGIFREPAIPPDKIWAIDVSDPRTPSYMHAVAHTYDSDSAAIVVANGICFSTSISGGLQVSDFSDPHAPTVVTSLPLPGSPGGLHWSSGLLYVAVGSDGVVVVDVSAPGAPAILGAVDTPGFVEDVTVNGTWLYLASSVGSDGFQVVDASDPAHPSFVGSVDTPGEASAVVCDGNYAFVADGSEGMQVIDASIPTSPVLVGHAPGFTAHSITRSGNLVALASVMLDVADPTSPTMLASVPSVFGNAAAFDASAEVTLIATSSGVTAVENGNFVLAPSASLSPLGATARGVKVDAGLAYVVLGGSGLKIVDLNAPSPMTVLGGVDTPGFALDVAIGAGFACVADGQSGIQVVDTSDPAHPALLGEWISAPRDASRVALFGSHAYVFTDLSRMFVVDLSDPSHPVPGEEISLTGTALDAIVEGTTLYVVSSSALMAFDIGDPAHPTLLDSEPMIGTPAQMVYREGYLFVATSAPVTALTGLKIFDVSLPGAILSVADHATPGSTSGIALDGDVAYLVSPSTGFEFVDVSNPFQPESLAVVSSATWSPSASPTDPFVWAGQLIWASGNSLRAIPLQCDLGVIPTLVQSFTARWETDSVRIEGAFAAFEPGDHASVRASTKTDGWEVPLEWVSPEHFEAIDLEASKMGNGEVRYLLRVDTATGLTLDLAEQTVTVRALAPKVRMIGASPNPFNPRTEIRFEAPYGKRTQVAVYDARGRWVESLFDGPASGIEQTLVWRPRSLSSGVYYVRVRTDTGSSTKRVVLVE